MIGINHNDARITTRWNEHDFKMAVFGVIHEAGHGMYEQDIDEKFAYTPIYQGTSMGIHESQSLFNEIIIGSNRSFWENNIHFSNNVQKEHSMIFHLLTLSLAETNPSKLGSELKQIV